MSSEILSFLVLIFSVFSVYGSKNRDFLKFREFNGVPKGLENSVSADFPNVELFVKWEKWSCCSACCCPKAVCKQFATIDNCKAVNSVKHRRGQFKIRRKGKTGNALLEDLFNKENEVNLEEGLKVEPRLKATLESLNAKLSVPLETKAVFQTNDCDDNVQKADCWELAKCMYGSVDMLPAKEVAYVEERDVCENASILLLREVYNIQSLEPEKLYRLQLDRSIGEGNLVVANFTFNGKKVERLSHVTDCAHQPKRVFQHPDGRDLIVRLSEEQLSKNPKIIAVISYQNPSRLEIVVDVVMRTKKKEERTVKREKWFPIVVISSLAVCTLILLGLSLFLLR